MGYDIFSQPQGVNIPISLFGDAAGAGTKVGSEIPSPVSAAIQGATKGYAIGQEFQLKDQQIKNAELAGQLQQLQIQKETDTQTLAIQDANEKAKNDIQKLQTEEQLRNQASAFNDQFAKADDQTKVQMVLGGEFNSLFAKDPNTYKTALSSIYGNPALTPQQKSGIDLFFKKSATSDYYDKMAAQNAQKFSEAKDALIHDPVTNVIAQKLPDTTIEHYPDKVDFVESGRYQVDPNTNKILLDDSGQKKLNPQFDPKLAAGTYDVFNKETGELLVSQAQKKSFEAYTAYPKLRSLVNGTYKNIALTNIEKTSAPAAPTSIPGTNVNPVAAPSGAPLNLVAQKLQERIGLTPDAVEKYKAPLDELQTTIQRYVNSPRNRVDLQQNLDIAGRQLTRSITDDEYDKYDWVKAQFTTSDVDKYNSALDRETDSVVLATPSLRSNMQATIDAMKVSSPKDLYYRRRLPAISSAINDAILELQKQFNAQESAPLRQVAAQQKLNAFLSQVK